VINLRNLTVSRSFTIVLHLAGWIMFILLPLLFFSPPRSHERFPRPENVGDNGFDIHSMWIQSIFFNLLFIMFFYFNMYVLIPKVFTRNTLAKYVVAVLISFAVVALASELINQVFLMMHIGRPRPLVFTVFNFLMILGLSTTLRLTGDRVRFERERKEYENERLKSELSLLRSQVSPHFMFNVLNSLASLARKRSDQLESFIIQLSHLMRYMLYESGEKRVTLEREVEYLKSYIDLQKLRFGNDVAIEFHTQVVRMDLPIEPMLLIPFVENAFKHGIGLISEPTIRINLTLDDHQLHFSVHNKFNKVLTETKDVGSGIGIQNVRRRLDLLYQDLYTLTIVEKDLWFMVDLKLILR
jgi:two-component system, LytTR family, sensor kinase